MTTMFDGRVARAQKAAAAAGIDALLVTPGPNLRYLVGYDAVPLERLTCLVVPAEGAARLVVPMLERPAAQASAASDVDVEIVTWDETDDPIALAVSLVGAAERVGVDDQMWAEKVLRFQAALPDAELSAAGAVMAGLRVIKTRDEVEALREAGAAIDRVHARVPEWLRPGRSELEVARDIGAAIVAEGHVRVDFAIVGSGPNSASPHHEPGTRILEPGDVVVVDIGGTTAAGYCSDSTRTYVLGEPSTEFAEAYAALHRAQEAAVQRVRPGVSAESIDAAAREVLADAGLGEHFVHRTGHGIGVEVHEEPYIVAGNSTPVEPGMAFSIEPGFYVGGRHGARIEDIVVVTDGGVERLNLRPRELVVVQA